MDFEICNIDFKFVNQVCGSSLTGKRISIGTRNNINGGVQCSFHGPDKFKFTPENAFQSESNYWFNHRKTLLCDDEVVFEPLFIPNNTCKNFKKRNAIYKRIPQNAPNKVKQWKRIPKWIRDNDILSSFFVVMNKE